MSIDIIGAGIGGLTTAIALKQKGIQSKIYEQAQELKPIGAAIILANNAMQVYDHLGLTDRIEEVGNHVSRVHITDPSLKIISAVVLQSYERKYGVKNIAIHRGQLQSILLEALGDSQIVLDAKLESLHVDKENITLKFSNLDSVVAKTLIGADGIHSIVRKYIFPDLHLRNAGQICWRGIAEIQLPAPYHSELNEAWGRGKRFGFVRLSSEIVYWYALVTSGQEAQTTSENLGLTFESFHPLVRDIIQATPITSIHEAEMQDLQPNRTWTKGKIVLVGDAAHATTPNMGQGACQAIEDAYFLANALERYDTQKAFICFQDRRVKKVNQIVNASWRLGKVAHWSNPVAMGVRNMLMRSLPQFVNNKQSEFVFKLDDIS